ncbi:MAG: hypothetical protein JWN02_2019, partial [Acidobacteria bacterium]|nr:hypothetical protein [Acidobacteriota bacterium]
MRRLVVCAALVCVAATAFPTLAATKAAKPVPKPFTIVEASIQDEQAALREGRITSRELVQQYLIRIA